MPRQTRWLLLRSVGVGSLKVSVDGMTCAGLLRVLTLGRVSEAVFIVLSDLHMHVRVHARRST